ncbi:arylsulfatase B-like [Dermacentor andersoni]|uniref:arylsulfatase B-like n=1 Tax=Dermacentor andersoni TaxID=34620 RepID=UPI003B3A87E6
MVVSPTTEGTPAGRVPSLQECVDPQEVAMMLRRCIAVALLMLVWPTLVWGLQKPHIVVIMVESLGWADVGFHGSRQMRTPNIDALAADGVILNKYYTPPSGVASRVGLLTGVYPYRAGITRTIHPSQPTALPTLFTTLPMFLKNLGYVTHFVGVWSLGFFKDEFTPENRGFDTAFAKWSGPGDYWTHVSSDRKYNYFHGYDLRLNREVLWNKTGTYATRAFTERATEIIAQHDKAKPLFMLIAHQGVQAANNYGSVQCPPEHLDTFATIAHRKRILLAGALAEVDDSVGKVFGALHNRSMLNDTVLIFVSSSGGLADREDESSNWSFNWPLRGTKGTYFEGGIRVPAFVWSPLLGDRSPRVSSQLMHVTDWLPTLVNVAGGDAKILGDLADFDSFNQWPTISKNLVSPRKSIIHNFDIARQNFVILLGQYKGLIATHRSVSWDRKSKWFPLEGLELKQPSKFEKRISSGEAYKVLQQLRGKGFNLTDPTRRGSLLNCKAIAKPRGCNRGRGPCLFDLANDPCEQDNVVDKHPAVVAKIKQTIIYGDNYVPWENEKMGDSDADPGLFGGVWVPWRSPPHNRYGQNKRSQDCHFDC